MLGQHLSTFPTKLLVHNDELGWWLNYLLHSIILKLKIKNKELDTPFPFLQFRQDLSSNAVHLCPTIGVLQPIYTYHLLSLSVFLQCTFLFIMKIHLELT